MSIEGFKKQLRKADQVGCQYRPTVLRTWCFSVWTLLGKTASSIWPPPPLHQTGR